MATIYKIIYTTNKQNKDAQALWITALGTVCVKSKVLGPSPNVLYMAQDNKTKKEIKLFLCPSSIPFCGTRQQQQQHIPIHISSRIRWFSTTLCYLLLVANRYFDESSFATTTLGTGPIRDHDNNYHLGCLKKITREQRTDLQRC